MNNPIYILGINGSSRASANLLKDGEIIAAALEERFTRIKNQSGFPKEAIDYCLKEAGIDSSDLTSVWIGFQNPTLFLKENDYRDDASFKFFAKIKPYFTKTAKTLVSSFPKLQTIYELRKSTPVWTLLDWQQKKYVAKRLNVSEQIIHTLDHHTAHGYAAYYTNSNLLSYYNKKVLVITLDGTGDDVCSRISVVLNHKWHEIASISNEYSIGELYQDVTQFLGMKPNEDEYKVMGLAPYAHPKDSDKVYSLFKELMWVEGLSVKSAIPRVAYYSFLKKNLVNFRFDAVAGGIQRLTEELTTQLVMNAIKKTGITNIILGGGVFMNVKANMKIAQIPQVKSLWVCPSSTDDSTAIGAAYFGYSLYCRKHHIPNHTNPPNHLYLGPSYLTLSSPRKRGSINNILNWIPAYAGMTVKVKKLKNPAKEIAKLLASDHIVARFAGRMEFGARALGNRSILADPRDKKVIKIINDIIKMRDFWMPFAPTILKEKANEYIINPKHLDSAYMMLAFETTKSAQIEIPAALHPYDQTCRPQILKKEQNPKFYEIIKEFEKITGIPALLNTSFNLHGEPIVCSPKDALDTFIKSGLKYLVLEDYLLSKK